MTRTTANSNRIYNRLHPQAVIAQRWDPPLSPAPQKRVQPRHSRDLLPELRDPVRGRAESCLQHQCSLYGRLGPCCSRLIEQSLDCFLVLRRWVNTLTMARSTHASALTRRTLRFIGG